MKPPLTLSAISEKKICAQTNSLILSLEDDEAAVGYAPHTSTNPVFFFLSDATDFTPQFGRLVTFLLAREQGQGVNGRGHRFRRPGTLSFGTSTTTAFARCR